MSKRVPKDAEPTGPKCQRCQQEAFKGVHIYPQCWHCHAETGCSRPACVGPVTEVLCYRGHPAAWATRDALLEHGFIRPPRGLPLTAYPESWQQAYDMQQVR